MSDKLVKKCFKILIFLCDPFYSCWPSSMVGQALLRASSGYQVKVNKKLSILFTEIGP